MKKCPAILGITFDNESNEGIKRIKELHDLSKYGRIALTIGQLYTIFGGSTFRSTTSSGASGLFNLVNDNTLKTAINTGGKIVSSEANQTAYAITQANWEYYFSSFDGLDKIKMAEIHKVAVRQALAHSGKPKEYQFWKSIAQGCKPQ